MANKYKWLNLAERKKIEKAYADGMSVSEISELIGKERTTIYRELQKGYTGELDENMRPGYSAKIAQERQNTLKAQRKNHRRIAAAVS